MITRKPKLNLLYASDDASRRLQLAVVTPSRSSSQQQHARQWQAARVLASASRAALAATPRKH